MAFSHNLLSKYKYNQHYHLNVLWIILSAIVIQSFFCPLFLIMSVICLSGSAFINPVAVVKATEREIQNQILRSED